MPSCLLPRWSNPLRRPAGYSWGPYLCHFSFPCNIHDSAVPLHFLFGETVRR